MFKMKSIVCYLLMCWQRLVLVVMLDDD